MKTDKIILRAAISTLIAIVILLLFMFGTMCAFFPSSMVKITYNLGMEKSSIHFAERAYKNGDDVFFIAQATETAIESGNGEKILSCGQKLIADDEFTAYCDEKENGEEYKRMIYGSVCVAQYGAGEKAKALDGACACLSGDFPTEKNPLVSLLIKAISAEDKDFVREILGKLETLSVEGAQKTYLDEAIKWAKNSIG